MATCKFTVHDAVLRSAPSTTRPRMSVESERLLADVEARSAACYAESEAMTEKLHTLAVSLAGDAIPVEIDPLEDTSTVTHIEEWRERVGTDATEPVKKP